MKTHVFAQRYVTLLVVLVCALSACSSLQTIEMPPSELAESLRGGQLLEIGDRVVIATNDGTLHKLRFSGIEEDAIIGGSGERIPIGQVAALKTPEFSMGRTALLGSAILASVWVYAIATFSIASIL